MNLLKSPGPITIAVASILCSVAMNASAQPHETWQTVYQDNYKYLTTPPYSAKFNTWFWREDAIGIHTFNDIDPNKCTQHSPCVKLTAPVSTNQGYPDRKTPYINSEMYNNSCVKQGVGHPQKQAYDHLLDLHDNPWNALVHNPETLHAQIGSVCDTPYPYRKDSMNVNHHSFAKDSWNTTTPGILTANRLAQWLAPESQPWQRYRDFAFNTPYQATPNLAQRITMTIKAQGHGFGSRGWGYWNTTMDFISMQFAWFMEIDSPLRASLHSPAIHGTYMMTVKGENSNGKLSIGYCMTRLPATVNIYKWHNYRIEWMPHEVRYWVDGKLYATHTKNVPNKALSFHNWVDNRNYGYAVLNNDPENYPILSDRSNYIASFSAAQRHIDKNTPADLAKIEQGPSDNNCGQISLLHPKNNRVYLIQQIIKDHQRNKPANNQG